MFAIFNDLFSENEIQSECFCENNSEPYNQYKEILSCLHAMYIALPKNE